MSDFISSFFSALKDPVDFLRGYGWVAYIIIFCIIFAESGLLVGFFLPGDTVLIAAGVLSGGKEPIFNLVTIMMLIMIAAILGDSVGYRTGKKYGPRLFTKEDSFFFHKKHIARAEHFYEDKGPIAIIIARFIPIIRTFAPIVAGIGSMNYRKFLFYNIFGGVFWTCFFVLGGYFLGSLIKDLEKYLLPIIIIAVIGTLIPAAYHLIKESKSDSYSIDN